MINANSKFGSEITPLPISTNVNNSIKESTLLQFHKNNTNSTGIAITVNSTTRQFLPANSYNVLNSTKGVVSFKTGNTAVFERSGIYTYNAVITASSLVNKGILAIDVVDKLNNSIRANAISTSNVNPNSISTLILNFVHNHNVSDEVKLRFGGGSVPGGTNLQINILSVQWVITEN
jgi:hypothetical protein